ncbi:MAG: hypothetical protein DWQ40_03470 [Actinobacteria bacterium]|nr:MAG: hypothetical protein DWQ40_03470 [Actinomycetota bacterium]
MKRPIAVLLMAFALVACTQGNVFSIEQGDCFNDEGDMNDQISSVPIVECSEPHDNEVYAVFEMTESEFPGFDVTADMADNQCLPEFESFVGTAYADSELEFGWLIPTEESWSSGDRQIVCFLFRLDLGKMTGTMEDSGI